MKIRINLYENGADYFTFNDTNQTITIKTQYTDGAPDQHSFDIFSTNELTKQELEDELKLRMNGNNHFYYIINKFKVETSKNDYIQSYQTNLHTTINRSSNFKCGDVGHYYTCSTSYFSSQDILLCYVAHYKFERPIQEDTVSTSDDNYVEFTVNRDNYIRKYGSIIESKELSGHDFDCKLSIRRSFIHTNNKDDYFYSSGEFSYSFSYINIKETFQLEYTLQLSQESITTSFNAYSNEFWLYIKSLTGYFSACASFDGLDISIDNEFIFIHKIWDSPIEKSNVKINKIELEYNLNIYDILNKQDVFIIGFGYQLENSAFIKINTKTDSLETNVKIPLNTVTIDKTRYAGENGNYNITLYYKEHYNSNTVSEIISNYYYEKSIYYDIKYEKLYDLDPFLQCEMFKYDNINIIKDDYLTLFNELFTDYELLGLQYLTRSGNKILSPLMLGLLYKYGSEYYPLTPIKNYLAPSNECIQNIWNIIIKSCGFNWLRLYKVYYTEIYDAFKPYDMNVDITNNDNLSSTDNTTKQNTITSEASNNTSANNRYAFNSTNNPVNVDVNLTSFNNTDKSKGTTDNTYNRDKTFTSIINRIGNIGNTSKQDLLLKEINLRKFKLQETIYSDLDRYFVCQKYI